MNQISIIVFSKDRPMQLHAYIESLLYYSDAKQKDITILYRKTSTSDYSKLIKIFPSINWKVEQVFYDDLIALISNAADYLMFGCDDVVFKKKFNLEFAKNILSKNEQVFGFSFRLGLNIQPLPKNISKDKRLIEWSWMNTDASHYDYPWELDCTLYRKADVIKMIQLTKEPIYNPNYFEGVFADNPSIYISRPNLVCMNQKSKAIVITVNRVQDTHHNPVDNDINTDIVTLNKIYNFEDNILDIKAISKIDNFIIHVGSEYFVLKNRKKNWKKPKIKRPQMKIISVFKRFLKNLIYLFRHNLNDVNQKSKNYVSLDNLDPILDYLKYEISDEINNLKKPNVKSPEETVKQILKNKASICRYGDGEFTIMSNKSILFQDFDKKLSARLKEIIKINDDKILICLPSFYYSSTKLLHAHVKNFVRTWVKENRNHIDSFYDEKKQYYATELTCPYASYKKNLYDFDNYYIYIKQVWHDRDIVIICGQTIFDKIKYNIFDNAKTIEYIYAPSKNAFFEYDSILEKAKLVSKEKIILIILGPTATVLAYDLAVEGFQALDFGHIAKDYDFFLKKVNHTNQSLDSFFSPD